MKKTITYIMTVFLTAACVYPYEAVPENTVDRDLVIDANILLGNASTVTLSYLQPLDQGRTGGASAPVSATVYLEDEAGTRFQANASGNTYSLNVPEQTGGKYRLTVECDGYVYRSEWVEPVAPPEVKDITFSADEDDVLVKVSMEDSGSGSGYAAVQIDEIWRFHTDFVREYDYDLEQDAVIMLNKPIDEHYWCWNKKRHQSQTLIDYSSLNGVVKDYAFYSFPRSDNRNHQEYTVRVKLWNLTPEQYKYRKMLEENASIGGNLFSPEPGEVRGNLYCETDGDVRVYGYVNVSSVSTLTRSLSNVFSKWKSKYVLAEVEPEGYVSMFAAGYLPVTDFVNNKGESVVGWGLARCYDCIAAGGTLEKPDFE